MFRIKRILYPTDFSSYSNQAYFHAVGLAELHNAQLTVMYVFNPAADQAGDRNYWRGQLEQIRPTNPAIAVEHVLLDGNPGEVIPQYAAQAGMDMVVMGTHGRSGLAHLVMGSVAERVVREAPCPVMTIKQSRAVVMAESPIAARAAVRCTRTILFG